MFTGSLTEQILQGPLEVIIGITFGLCFGILLIYFPHANDVSSDIIIRL